MARRKSLADSAVDDLMDLLLMLPWQGSAILLLGAVALEFGWRSNLLVVVFGYVFIVAALVSLGRHAQRAQLLRQSTRLDEIRRLSWREFEELVTQAYHKQGYLAERRGGSGPDGGVDVVLHGHGETVIV